MGSPLPIGFYPFWFWNDTLSAQEVRWQIEQMASQGVRGFYIHSRQGLGQPYLSHSFFQMVDVAIESAAEHGMVVHLYDEYPYPSGVAGGEVILGCPQYYATRLVQEVYDVEGGSIWLKLPAGKVLSCAAYPCRGETVDWTRGVDLREHVGPLLEANSYVETGLTRYNRKRYFASEPTPVLSIDLPTGPYRIYLSVQVEVDHFKYWDRYVDVLNPDAIGRFIQLTHERYRERIGDQFGRAVRSIFVDETAPRWSDRVPGDFAAAYGYDLEPMLVALQDSSHPQHLRVRYDLYRLLYHMFCASFEEPISNWCRANGLAYAGEKPSLRMSQLRYMDIPGCEPGHTKAGARFDMLCAPTRANAKATASAAYFYGKEGALCECYHSMGWSATLQDAKLIADGLLLLGISYLVPHGFFYSTHALKKHDAPPTFFFQMPFWPLFGGLAERVDRIRRLFEGTHIDAELLVVDPASGIPTSEDLRIYEELLWLLMEQHIDYHIVDTDILEGGRIAGGCVQVADIAAKVVLLPPMQIVEEPLQRWLDRYVQAGGKVIYCQRAFEGDALLTELLAVVQPSLNVQVGGKEEGRVWVVKRVGAARTLWFVLNTSDQVLPVDLRCGSRLREIPLEGDLPSFLGQDGRQSRRTLQPFESVLLEAVETLEVQEQYPVLEVTVGGLAKLELRDPNLLRLGEWHMSLLEEGQVVGDGAAVPAVPLANQLQQARFHLAPAFRHYFGHVPEMELPELHVRYEATFGCVYGGAVELVMEPGSIVGDWQISFNGAPPLRTADFSPTTAHVRGSLGHDITDLLREGENVLQVDVITGRLDGGLLNPLYLAGDFGVQLEPLCLVDRSETGHFERYWENLLPYYAGAIEYTTEFHLEEVPESEWIVLAFSYAEPFCEATRVSVNGSPPQDLAWHPRRIRLESKYLIAGTNLLRTEVLTTLVRSFEGQWFDYEAHTYRSVSTGS